MKKLSPYDQEIIINDLLSKDIDLVELHGAINSGQRVCVNCGCSDLNACAEGCFWIDEDHSSSFGICSSCQEVLEQYQEEVIPKMTNEDFQNFKLTSGLKAIYKRSIYDITSYDLNNNTITLKNEEFSGVLPYSEISILNDALTKKLKDIYFDNAPAFFSKDTSNGFETIASDFKNIDEFIAAYENEFSETPERDSILEINLLYSIANDTFCVDAKELSNDEEYIFLSRIWANEF